MNNTTNRIPSFEQAKHAMHLIRTGHTLAKTEIAIALINKAKTKRIKESTNRHRTEPYNERPSEQRKQFIKIYKMSHGCAFCGYNDHPIALDLDHINPGTKEIDIGDLHKRSWETMFKEIQKCQVLCAICHRYKTETDRLDPLTTHH
tara:strand:+ start:298 stop:738 length:441 start_codon:yes stop_codon:yes gene_type:complete